MGVAILWPFDSILTPTFAQIVDVVSKLFFSSIVPSAVLSVPLSGRTAEAESSPAHGNNTETHFVQIKQVYLSVL